MTDDFLVVAAGRLGATSGLTSSERASGGAKGEGQGAQAYNPPDKASAHV